MSAIIPKLKLIYISVPKCACTSLKETMYFLQFKKKWKNYKNELGEDVYVHDVYGSPLFSEMVERFPIFGIKKFTKICVIRDPIKRLISAYTNRVLHHNELAEWRLKDYGLDCKLANPNFFQFIENYELYFEKVRSIKHHTRPMHDFIGEDPSFYDRIYNLNNIDDFSEFIEKKYNIKYQIPRRQTGGGEYSINIDIIKQESRQIYDKLKAITAKDYEIFSDFLEKS